ncbi:MAG: hypothetical protein Q6363_009785 [Candidatus Njordarchaeota archaeon]
MDEKKIPIHLIKEHKNVVKMFVYLILRATKGIMTAELTLKKALIDYIYDPLNYENLVDMIKDTCKKLREAYHKLVELRKLAEQYAELEKRKRKLEKRRERY